MPERPIPERPIALGKVSMRCRFARNDGSLTKKAFGPATGWVANLRREQLLTFGDTIAISIPPGTTSGLLPLDGNCE
jgi:hypothetical protein